MSTIKNQEALPDSVSQIPAGQMESKYDDVIPPAERHLRILQEEEQKAEVADELLQRLNKLVDLDGDISISDLDNYLQKIEEQVKIISEFEERKKDVEWEMDQLSVDQQQAEEMEAQAMATLDREFKGPSDSAQKEDSENPYDKEGEEAGSAQPKRCFDNLVWEPITLVDKMKCLTRNLFEILYLIGIAIMSLAFPSTISCGFFIISYFLIFTMTEDQLIRFKLGKFYLIFKTLVLCLIIFWKITKIKTMVNETTDKKVYDFEKRYYEALGFTLVPRTPIQNDDGSTTYAFDPHFESSFVYEGYLFFVLIMTALYFFIQTNKIDYLTSAANQNDINEYKKLLDPEVDPHEGTIELTKAQKKQKKDRELEDKKRLLELSKKIKKNFIDSDYFYSFNTKFFLTAVLFQMFAAMSFNSLSDTPQMLIILILAAFYANRKQHSQSYRRASFGMIYFMMTMLSLKLINDILNRIPFVRDFMRLNRDNLLVRTNSIVFGGAGGHEDSNVDQTRALMKYFFSVITCLFACQAWKCTKWVEIRYKTQDMRQSFWIFRLRAYFNIRESEDNTSIAIQRLLKNNEGRNKRTIKSKIDKLQEAKYDSGKIKAIKKGKINFNKYLPTIVLWVSRFNMFLMVYLYHSNISFMNLIWIIASFLLPMHWTFFISIWFMIPLLSLEFLFTYASRIPIVKDLEFFKHYGTEFQWKMVNPVLEQTLMFGTLVMFYMQLSCYFVSRDVVGEQYLIGFFRKRITDPRYSNLWKIAFFGTRYIQSIALLLMFIHGLRDLYTVQNLGFMIFFVVYTAYEELYRRTSVLLIIFISIFIVGQYYTSLHYRIYVYNDQMRDQLKFYTIFPNNSTDPFGIAGVESIYFRLKPRWFDWTILLMMSLLNNINEMYQNKEEISKLQEDTMSLLQDDYKKSLYYYNRVQNIVKGLMIWAVIILMIGAISGIETNIINWVFLGLNMMLFGFLIRGNKSIKSIRNNLRLVSFIKIYSMIILMSNIMFILFIGEKPKENQPNSNDQQFKRAYPNLYNYLDIIGFRTNVHILTKEEQVNAFGRKFAAYIIFFLLSIYLHSYFQSQLHEAKGEESFQEKDYKKLFEFKTSKNSLAAQKAESMLHSLQVSIKAELHAEDEWDKGYHRNTIFKQRAHYTQQHLIDFYESTRFTVPFMIYRKMEWWPMIDAFAMYGHVIHYTIVMVVAINVSTSCYSCFNVLCMGAFYLFTTQQSHAQANKNFQLSGLQTQCDVSMARLITKRFKTESQGLFLKIRRAIWHLQFVAIITMVICGYPTSLLNPIRMKQTDPETIKKIDNFSFWVFFIGIYKDMRPDTGNSFYYYATFTSIIIGLIIERQCINWLKNRNGCTYFRVQKYVELDQRREAIRYNWEKCPPAYEPEKYKEHYFMSDWDNIEQRFKQNTIQREPEEDDYKNKTIQDFLPYKVAYRMRDTIAFKVQLDARAPEIGLDDQSKELLEEGNYDYESIPVLRDYKVKSLERILEANVDRKYKISLAKGMQLAMEQLIMLIMMLSLVMKANLISLMYLIFLFKYAFSVRKTDLLVRFQTYMTITLGLQYIAYLLNLNAMTSPAPFPPGFFAYPKNAVTHKYDPPGLEDQNDPSKDDRNISHWIPFFFHFKVFRFLEIDYLLGIGIDKDQIQSLMLDFLNLYIVTMYVLIYRNPILVKRMKKVFWQFPQSDNIEQWQRLDKPVQKQVKWLFNPKKLLEISDNDLDAQLDPKAYNKEISNYKNTLLDTNQIKMANNQYQFALEYNKQNKYDLNYLLTTYVDLKYINIWSEEFMKMKKREIKSNSTYFRIVKQGSVFVYLTFHIITIFIILLMAVMRQSLFSIGYVLLLVPRFKDAAEVLDQRAIQQFKSKGQLIKDIEHLKENIKILEENESNDYYNEELEELREQLDEKEKALLKIQDQQKKMNFLKRNDSKKEKDLEWKMIKVVKKYLIFYGLFDFALQIIAQMPLIDENRPLSVLGFRKIWKNPNNPPGQTFKFHHYIDNLDDPDEPLTLKLDMFNFVLQFLNCVIISSIMLQGEIFESAGYKKFVTQQDGSMDLLVQLSEIKKKSSAYVFNNFKIRKILSIQRKKEAINGTVERIRQKLIRWRKFTRTTLVDEKKIKNEPQNPESLNLTHQRTSEMKMIKKQSDLQIKKKINSSTTKEEGDEIVREKVQQKVVEFFVDHEEEELKQFMNQRKAKVISSEESLQLQAKLADEFVKSKMNKMKWYVRFYNWLNKTFTEQILFKNNKKELEALKFKHAQGEVYIPTELEKIMKIEAVEAIKQHYDNIEGGEELTLLLNKTRGDSSLNLLQITNFDKKIKLNMLRMTYEFTKPVPMVIRLIETVFYIIISQTQNLIYFSMILSMYMNAGLISIYYPLTVFGYALIEESRPNMKYWQNIRSYTIFVMMFKLCLNLSIFDKVLRSEQFNDLSSYLKIGIYEYSSSFDLITYMMPEILILCFIMLNEIKLKLLGLYYENEMEVETIQEGIQRNMEKGDEEVLEQKKIKAANMCMSQYFESTDDQKVRQEELHDIIREQVKREIRNEGEEIDDDLVEIGLRKELNADNQKDNQNLMITEIASFVHKTSRKFDLDSQKINSTFDQLIFENVVQKSLETDNLKYYEGIRKKNQPEFMSVGQFQTELMKKENWDPLEAGMYEQDFDEKFAEIDKRKLPKLGWFEKQNYFDSIFPSLRIQKPGYDLYGSITIVLVMIAIFVFNFFTKFNVDPDVFKFMTGKSALFKTDMALTLLVIIIIIVLERYANRTDTKAAEENRKKLKSDLDNSKKKGFFSNDQMFKRTTTARSMTVKLKTMKTTDLDLQGGAAQNFLEEMYGNDDEDGDVDESRTKITRQQKTKYLVHWFVLIAGHLYIFWFVPISGNMRLYDQAACNYEKREFYGCKNFHENYWLRVFYVLIILYLVLSSLQLSYGFPILKKPSSVLQYNNDLGNIGATLYMSIPFACELRCLADFAFTKTSLDIFQFYQLFVYHQMMFVGKNGNRYYDNKVLGSQTTRVEKCIFGFLIGFIFMVLMAGPFVMFSEFGGLVAENPVKDADIELALIVKNSMYSRIEDGSIIDPSKLNFGEQIEFQNEIAKLTKEEVNDRMILQQIPYRLYKNDNPFFRQYDEVYWKNSKYSNWTETNYFKPSEVQECVAQEYSDDQWLISEKNLQKLKLDVGSIVNRDDNPYNDQFIKEIQLEMKFKLQRDAPASAIEAKYVRTKTLDFKWYDDCITGKQLKQFTEMDCKDGNKKGNALIMFRQALIPAFVLGQTVDISVVDRETENKDNQMHDVAIQYDCDFQTWQIHMSDHQITSYEDDELEQYEVDPETCEFLDKENIPPEFKAKWYEKQKTASQIVEEQIEKDRDEWKSNYWGRLRITLFSMLVSASFLSTYTPGTFYTFVLFSISAMVRPIFIYFNWCGFVYETTKPDAIIKLIEGIVMHQHEEDLVGEEECYRMLQEIMRQPELYKSLCGSCLKGPTDPALDTLSEEKKTKLAHLEKLEQKGFDVTNLKKKLLGQKQLDGSGEHK